MKKIKFKHVGFFVLIALITVFFDRFIKIAALNFLAEDVNIINGFLKLDLSGNTGIAFSIGLPMIIQLLIFPVLFILGLYLIYKYYDASRISVQLISGLIAGGAIGNFIDRINFGYVIDYISVSIFPVFNFADIVIVIGIFLLIVFYGKIKRA